MMTPTKKPSNPIPNDCTPRLRLAFLTKTRMKMVMVMVMVMVMKRVGVERFPRRE